MTSALLALTAALELATGTCLLAVPQMCLELLLGIREAAAETTLISRFAGAALVAFGIAAWGGRSREPPSGALVTAALAYDILAAALLAHAALSFHMLGIALWPGVVLHSALAIWCAAALAKTSFTRKIST
jgi:hypothetical protein